MDLHVLLPPEKAKANPGNRNPSASHCHPPSLPADKPCASANHLRSDKGSEFTATRAKERLEPVGVKILFMEPGSPWKTGYKEKSTRKPREESLNGEIVDTALEAKVLVGSWRRQPNTVWPRRALGYRPPAPEAMLLIPSSMMASGWEESVSLIFSLAP